MWSNQYNDGGDEYIGDLFYFRIFVYQRLSNCSQIIPAHYNVLPPPLLLQLPPPFPPLRQDSFIIIAPLEYLLNHNNASILTHPSHSSISRLARQILPLILLPDLASSPRIINLSQNTMEDARCIPSTAETVEIAVAEVLAVSSAQVRTHAEDIDSFLLIVGSSFSICFI